MQSHDLFLPIKIHFHQVSSVVLLEILTITCLPLHFDNFFFFLELLLAHWPYNLFFGLDSTVCLGSFFCQFTRCVRYFLSYALNNPLIVLMSLSSVTGAFGDQQLFIHPSHCLHCVIRLNFVPPSTLPVRGALSSHLFQLFSIKLSCVFCEMQSRGRYSI